VVKQVDHLVKPVYYPGKAGLPGVVKPVDPNNTHITIPIEGQQQQRLISDRGTIVDRDDGAKNGVVVEQSTQIISAPEPDEKQEAAHPMTGAEKKEAGARPGGETGGLTGKPVRQATVVGLGVDGKNAAVKNQAGVRVEKQEDGHPAVAEIIAYAASKGFEVAEDCARDFLAAAGGAGQAKRAVDWAADAASSKVRRGEKIRNPAGLLFAGLRINSGARLDPGGLDSDREKRLAEKEDKYRDIYIT
jgi:hypothetical protein